MLSKIKDPGSAITHGIALLLSIIGAFPLLARASQMPGLLHVVSMSIYIFSMILLYAASTNYHTIDYSENVNMTLKKIDHSMISVMIAGSYTPICLIVLHGKLGYILFAIVWATALLGIAFKLFWVTCPRWVSSVLYIGMGWLCILAFIPLFRALPAAAFGLLLAGGILYTVGGIIYALKIPWFDDQFKHFGLHEIFHVFVMLGSILHYLLMYLYISRFPIA
ncbi:MAG: PAQR family membrane homeostasis protein TrhA [Lachnospiraceae bacterium]